MRAAPEVGVRGLIWRDHAGAGARLDRHVADGHAAIHRQRTDRTTAVLENITLAAAGADLRNHRKNNVFGSNAFAQLALDGDRHRLERLQWKRLRGEHVLNLARTDAERHRPERTVGARVAVAADHGDSWLGQPELWTDDVHDALLNIAERVQAHAELFRVATKRLDLSAASEVGNGLVDVERRGVVIFRRDRQVGAAHGAAGHA